MTEENAKNKREKRFFNITVVIINLFILGIAILIINTKEDYSVNKKENSYLIGASYMTMNNEFYKIMSEEISARVEAEGDILIVRDPALNADRQIEQIREMLGMGIDVLVLTPVEWSGLASVLEQARAQEVLIVVVDTNIYDEHLADCTITSDNYMAGKLVGEYFVEQNGGQRLVIMTHEATKSGQERVRGFLDVVEKHNDVEIVQKLECEGQTEIAMPKLQRAIDSGVAFDSIFCLNDLASVGVIAALEDNDMLETVGVYGVDASPDSKALIKEGMMKASAAQFPSEIGSEAADAIYRLLAGRQVEKKILVPVQLITRENVEAFGTDRWQ